MFHAITPVLITRLLQENAGELRSISEVSPGGVQTRYRDFNQTFNRCDKVSAHTSMLPQYVCYMVMFLLPYVMLLLYVMLLIYVVYVDMFLCEFSPMQDASYSSVIVSVCLMHYGRFYV